MTGVKIVRRVELDEDYARVVCKLLGEITHQEARERYSMTGDEANLLTTLWERLNPEFGDEGDDE